MRELSADNINENKMKIDEKENKVTITVDPKTYSLDAVYGASYVFIDRAYIFLEEKGNKTAVNIKGKEKMTPKKLEAMGGEFMNELLNSGLRHLISKNNKKLREYIAGIVLFSASKTNAASASAGPEIKEEEGAWMDDPLGIAVPWEEKFMGDKDKDDKKC